MKRSWATKEHWPFFEELRTEWTSKLDAQGQPESLRLLIERFNPANYTFEMRDGRHIPVEFRWPEAIDRVNAQDLQRISAETMMMHLPRRCRDRLDTAQPLTQEELTWLWEYLQSIEAHPAPVAVDGDPLIRSEDVLCGAIAVLIVMHGEWLAADPERLAWCRRQLETVLRQPPNTSRFDSETAKSECKWDTFAAEAGVALLAGNRDDALARRLVATGVIGFHYDTTARTLVSACRQR